jgi:hypothetical protein
MTTVPDPTRVRRPGMIADQEKYTVFLKRLITSPEIEVSEFTYYNDSDDPSRRREAQLSSSSRYVLRQISARHVR